MLKRYINVCPVGSLKEYWERRQKKKKEKRKKHLKKYWQKISNFLIYKINPYDEVVQ